MSDDASRLADGNNAFAFDLYTRLAESESGNLFFSPASISTAFGMTWAGARGETQTQMAEVLRFALPPEQLHPAFGRLNEALTSESDESGYRLHIANRLWGQQGEAFLPEYLDLVREHYGAEPAEVDFAGQTEQARRTINDWVEDRTEGKITDLIPRNALDPLTKLVLTNAVYFKGAWTNPFNEKQTQETPFHLAGGETVSAPMMTQQATFLYAEFENLQVLGLPYGEEKHLSMVVLLPKTVDGIGDLEKRLTAENLQQWTAKLASQKVRVILPKFEMASQFRLGRTLQAMGMERAFNPDRADFSGMNGRRDLYLSAAVHKAFVDVNEEGTEAAAATGIAVGATSAAPMPPPVFRADHPFVFLVRDNRTKSILFLGRLTNPAAETST